MYNRTLTLALGAVLSVGALAAAQAQDNPYGAPPWTFCMAQDTMDHPWRSFMVTSAAEQAKKYPEFIEEFIFTDGKGTNEKQIADVEDLISRGCDLIMMSPREAQGLVPAVDAIKEAGLPLVVLDREIVGDDYNVFIGADNLPIGNGLGEYALELLGTEWNFLELEGIPGATPTIQRREGFHAIIGQHDGIVQLDAQPANYDLAPAIPIVEDWLTKHRGEFQAIYAHNDPMILGAVNVLKEAGYEPGEITLIGVDGQREAFEAIREGWVQATAIYPTGGALGVDTAVKLMLGRPVPKRIISDAPIITADNVDEFYDPDLQYVR